MEEEAFKYSSGNRSTSMTQPQTLSFTSKRNYRTPDIGNLSTKPAFMNIPNLFVVDLQIRGLDDVGGLVVPPLDLVEEVDERAEHEAVVRVQRVQALGLELGEKESLELGTVKNRNEG